MKIKNINIVGYQPTDILNTSNPPTGDNDNDCTKELLQDIISWEKDLSEYESLETILRDKYIILKR